MFHASLVVQLDCLCDLARVDRSIHVVRNSCARPLVPTLPSLSRLFSVLGFVFCVPDGSGILSFEF